MTSLICACGQRVTWEPPGSPVPLERVACPSCGREHIFSLFEKMDVALSELCNFRCNMCRRPSRPGTLERGQVERVLDQAAALGLSTVSFCGGEPFIHPDFIPIARHAIDLGLKVQLTTNGSLVTPENIRQLTGLDCLTVSIDALQKTHDAIRGHPGAFVKACEALRLAADAGIPRGTNTVIQRRNAGELEALFDHLMQTLDGRLDYVRHAPVEVVPETAGLMVTEAEIPLVHEQLDNIAAACDASGVYFSHRTQLLDHLPLYLDKWTRHRPLGGCRIPRKFIGYSDLGFYLCWHQGHSIRARSLVEALESPVARQVVAEAAAGRCVGCNALTYSWDEEWNQGILAGKLVRDGRLPCPDTTIHGRWAEH